MTDCEVIIVGAGLAGLVTAISLKKMGIDSLVLERGDYPGAKNMFGGILFAAELQDLLGEDFRDMPYERVITSREFAYLSPKDALTLKLYSRQWAEDASCAYTVHRAAFDRWLADRAEKLGIEIYPQVIVQDLVFADNRVAGVQVRAEKAGELETLHGKIVVIAEGANALLTERAGLRNRASMMKPENRVLSVKEVIHLGEQQVNERFGLCAQEGCGIAAFGEPNNYCRGVGFVYTNRDTVSIGLGVLLQDLMQEETPIYDMLARFKSHPYIAPRIQGGSVREYTAHMIAEDDFFHPPKRFGNGVLVVGDAAGLVNMSFHMEATNLAIISARFAAQTIHDALKTGDCSASALRSYEKRLKGSFIHDDLLYSQRFMDLLTVCPEWRRTCPDFFVSALQQFFTPQNRAKRKIIRDIFRRLRKEIGLFRFLRLLFKSRRIFI